jgi:hypothetical protein
MCAFNAPVCIWMLFCISDKAHFPMHIFYKAMPNSPCSKLDLDMKCIICNYLFKTVNKRLNS